VGAGIKQVLAQVTEFLKREGGNFAPTYEPDETLYTPRQYDFRSTTRCLEEENSSVPSPGVPIRFFHDGIQKTFLVGYLVREPYHLTVHFSTVASIILKIQNGNFSLWNEPRIATSILVPMELYGEELPPPFVDTGAQRPYFEELRMRAVETSRHLRQQLEKEHLREWTKTATPSEYIAVDGTLRHLHGLAFKNHIIGLSKSFHPLFFDAATQQKAMQIREGERSFAFSFTDEAGETYSSWFLRLRNPAGKDPEFGLLRIEFGEPEPPPDFIHQISSSIFRLRYPVAYPYPRWDRLLYPIRLCTETLNNFLPSAKTIQYYFGWSVR